ncbi:MAG: hypothetical protein M3494_03285 [Actinomycetota bacterium]|jgi:hypothetical protein|nr:hypothetical protein [Actinomycetota bacterium]
MSITRKERDHNVELAKESRLLLAKTAKKLDVQREITRLTKCPAAGIIVRQLLFHDPKKKMCEDYWVFKGPKDWERDEGLTRSQVRTATRKIEEFGLSQVDTERPHPIWGHKTTFYRLDIYRVMQVADPAKLDVLEPELRYLEPDIRDAEEFDVDELFLSDGDEDFDDDAPPLTDEDAPEEEEVVDWWPEDLGNTAGHKGDHGLANDPSPGDIDPCTGQINPSYTEKVHRGTTAEEELKETPTFSWQNAPSAQPATPETSRPQTLGVNYRRGI